MAQSHGQRAWARARLKRGSSTGEVWEIGSEYPEARLSIGTDPSAGWPIQAAGVQPLHCELFWDGQSLWVADSYATGAVYLDGQRVGDWVQVQGPAELRLGQASLELETSTPAHERMASSPNEARPVTVTDMVLPERRSQAIFGGAAGDDSIPDLESAATRVVASPFELELEAERTRIAGPGHLPPPSSGAADLRPRLGGASGTNGAPSAEATRMVAMPIPPAPAAPTTAAAQSLASAPAPVTAAAQSLAPAPVVAPPPAPIASSPPAPALPSPPQLPAVPDPSVVPPAPAQAEAPAFVGPPADPTREAAKKKPPVQEALAKVLAKLKPEKSEDVLAKSGAAKGQTVPTRTWIMLAVTLLAAVGVLLWEDEPAEVAAPQQQVQAQGGAAAAPSTAQPTAVQPAGPTPAPTDPAAVADPSAAVPSAPAPTAPTAAADPGAPPTLPTPAVVPPVAAPPAAQTPSTAPASPGGRRNEPPPPTLARQAIDHYIHGRYADALVLYRQLALQSPGDPAYTTMVRILERRLECAGGSGPGGMPCAN